MSNPADVVRPTNWRWSQPPKEGEAMFRIALRALAVLALPALTLLACVQMPPLVVEMSTGELVRLEPWSATLSGSTGEIRGTATMWPATYRETLATITLHGASAGAVHAWYVHLGECGRDLGILVGPQAYEPVAVDGEGNGTTSVTLPFTIPTSGRFFVSVRQSDSDRSAVVACGNLTKGRPGAEPTIAIARAP